MSKELLVKSQIKAALYFTDPNKIDLPIWSLKNKDASKKKKVEFKLQQTFSWCNGLQRVVHISCIKYDSGIDE